MKIIKVSEKRYLTISETAKFLGMERNDLYAKTKNKVHRGLERHLLYGVIILFPLEQVRSARKQIIQEGFVMR